MLSDMAEGWGVAKVERTVERDEQLKSVRADLERPGEFTRVWLVSNGDDVLLVTFVLLESSAAECSSELDEATAIVDSLKLPAHS